ncbi:hypothetical protein AX769_20960 (plasmid) [Frondihabitans sp. PAMC 28766]|uniref:DUF2316 family protein n=1 Tax=Frondihabitans sp. PAMC 28766 TaxID=1795630 RepID=UPI00078CC7FC|nr:DUF2316 family protein [Frondihabitans sp. PAMC 28766]AMM22614.1 hypothetical protein AX769_20960 [Frondihabitans sp. PAMC 28766]
MSLNRSEQAQTRDELHANLRLSRFTLEEVGRALGWDTIQTTSALDVAGTDPRDVWLVRDYLDRVVAAAGLIPLPYSTLTEHARSNAEAWFGLYDVDTITKGTTP